jgi:thiazolinyl imide reductase
VSEPRDNENGKLRVVVCGATFGQVYLNAFTRAGMPFVLAGVLARGSNRALAAAERHAVPLFTDTAHVPDDVDIVCVVVRSTSMGGNGTNLAKHFLSRGMHVIQEHPVHHDELVDCLAMAERHGVIYRLNTFYPQLLPVRQFIRAARRLLGRQPAVYVDAACAIQSAYSLIEVLALALGSVRPWRIGALTSLAQLREMSETPTPFRSLDAVMAGVPMTLRVQNQTDPGDPDNHLHLLHRVTIGTRGGSLTLVNTHGPILWSPAMHISRQIKDNFDLRAHSARCLDFPSTAAIGPAQAPSYREIFGELWPDAITVSLLEMRRAMLDRSGCRGRAQHDLAVCHAWRDVTSSLGYPEMIAGEPTEPLAHTELAPSDEPCGIDL